MAVTRIKFSAHMTKDRVDRYLFIAENIGFGTPVKVKDGYSGTKMVLSSTGIITVMSDDNMMITLYPADFKTLTWMYSGQPIPKKVKNQLKVFKAMGFDVKEKNR